MRFLVVVGLAVALASPAAGQAIQPFTHDWDKGGSDHGQQTPWGWQEGYIDAVRRINRTPHGQFPLPTWCESYCIAGLGIRGACMRPGAIFTMHGIVNAAGHARVQRRDYYRRTGSPWSRVEPEAKGDATELLQLLGPRVAQVVINSGALDAPYPVTLDNRALNAAGIPFCR